MNPTTLPTSSPSTIQATARLSRTTRTSWVPWFAQLKYNCMFRGIWAEVDPDAPDGTGSSSGQNTLAPPSAPTALQLVADENERRGAAYERQLAAWEAQPSESRGEEPRPPRLATKRDINPETLDELRKDYTVQIAEWTALSTRRTSIWDWIVRTVDEGVLGPILEELALQSSAPGATPSAINLRTLVRLLRRDCAPSDRVIETTVRSEYREVLSSAEGMDPLRWYGKWHQAYVRARARNIPEVQGELATQDFLVAVGRRFAPDWASRQLENLLLGESKLSLEQYGQIFAAQIQQQMTISRAAPGVFATSSVRSGSPGSNQYTCPCQTVPSHPHDPLQCVKLLDKLRDKDERTCRIIQNERYKSLRDALRKDGVRLPEEKSSGGQGGGFPSGPLHV